jgi:hypothetical protein
VKTWANIIGYEVVWLLAVWGARTGTWWLGPLAMLPFAAFYLTRREGWRDAMLWLSVGLIGACLDSLLAMSDLLAYATAVPSTRLAPLWIIAIWMSFALTLRHTWRFAFDRLPLMGVVGAVGGPLAYLGAAHGFHALAFPHGTIAGCVALAVLWALALPGCIALARTVDRRYSWSAAHA